MPILTGYSGSLASAMQLAGKVRSVANSVVAGLAEEAIKYTASGIALIMGSSSSEVEAFGSATANSAIYTATKALYMGKNVVSSIAYKADDFMQQTASTLGLAVYLKAVKELTPDEIEQMAFEGLQTYFDVSILSGLSDNPEGVMNDPIQVAALASLLAKAYIDNESNRTLQDVKSAIGTMDTLVRYAYSVCNLEKSSAAFCSKLDAYVNSSNGELAMLAKATGDMFGNVSVLNSTVDKLSSVTQFKTVLRDIRSGQEEKHTSVSRTPNGH